MTVSHLAGLLQSPAIAGVLCFGRVISFKKCWKHFVSRFNDVYASGNNSAGSERIWMKFGILRAYCQELALTDFGIRAEAIAGARAEILFFFVW